jgi:hypothetical protein
MVLMARSEEIVGSWCGDDGICGDERDADRNGDWYFDGFCRQRLGRFVGIGDGEEDEEENG